MNKKNDNEVRFNSVAGFYFTLFIAFMALLPYVSLPAIVILGILAAFSLLALIISNTRFMKNNTFQKI